jgi:glutamate formiminotransferase/formiminotetrahydrofolate cyclodeaminase
MSVIECVPNISEGRDKAKIAAVVDTIRGVPGVTLVSCESDADHNRSVITFAGTPDGVVEAAFRIYAKAVTVIDLNHHKGEHPRMGAVDVCPFIPVKNATMEQCAELARKLGARVGKELGVPVYLYESAATRPERKNLADIRKGEFEGLREVIGKDPARVPDFGPNAIHATAGCTAIGARFFLIAYNVNLDTPDVAVAKKIAKAIREKDGGMPGVKAMGFAIEQGGRGYAQVSMNLVDYRKTSPAQAYARIAELAAADGVAVYESEIVGVIPQESLDASAAQALKVKHFTPRMVLENCLEPTGPDLTKPDAYMAGVSAFLDDLASANPTPGGGAAAAVLGGIGCALASMVGNLTLGKKKYADVQGEVEAVLKEAAVLRRELVDSYKSDIAAFDKVMAALGMAKNTDEEKAIRAEAIQTATKAATLTPLECAEAAVAALKVAERIAKVGNTNAISDAGVAALSLTSAVFAATLNMRINLATIKDEAFKVKHMKLAEDLESEASRIGASCRAIVLSKI